ncbi:hypothetical protein PV797_00535 [Clostridiaceae bacterium M8S5]|nr:hypothetical protein PV797_00535 [Clostridiaceae bacterium M8S5]
MVGTLIDSIIAGLSSKSGKVKKTFIGGTGICIWCFWDLQS